jgi:hypothetical protein
LPKGKCPPGRGQKKCPTGATIASKTACKDLYGVLNKKNQTKARRLLQNSVASKQTATITFTLKSLKGAAKDVPTAKANVDSVLQLQSELQTTLSMVVSGTEASMIYKVTNLGTSAVKPSQVTEKLRGFLNSGDSKVKTALAGLGTVKLGAKGCCVLSTNVKTVVDKSPCGTTGVSCGADKYQDPSKKDVLRGSDGGKAACCIAKATCAKHTCTGAFMKDAKKVTCVGPSNTCQASCCVTDPAKRKCGTSGVSCDIGSYQDPSKTASLRGKDAGKTSCCTAKAKCSAAKLACGAGQEVMPLEMCTSAVSSCTKTKCCKKSDVVDKVVNKTCASFKCPSGTTDRTAATKCGSTCFQATCCDDVPEKVVKGSVSFEVTLPSNVTQAQFLNDVKVKTGVQKGVAKKLGVNHTWVTVTLTAGSSARRLSPSRSLAGAKANINVDFTVTVPAGTAGGATSAATIQSSLTASTASSDSQKTQWNTDLVAEIKAASPTTYANVAIKTSSVAHVPPTTTTTTTATVAPESPNKGSASGSVAIGANIVSGLCASLLVKIAIGLADMAL